MIPLCLISTHPQSLARTDGHAFYGYPSDYLERFRAGIEKVTPADVAAWRKISPPRPTCRTVVGNSAEFEKPLSSMGTVSNVDITIPEPLAKRRRRTGETQLPRTPKATPCCQGCCRHGRRELKTSTPSNLASPSLRKLPVET